MVIKFRFGDVWGIICCIEIVVFDYKIKIIIVVKWMYDGFKFVLICDWR